MENKYVPIKIPRDLIVDIDKLVGTHGFRSRAEVAKEAIRRLLTEFNKKEASNEA